MTKGIDSVILMLCTSIMATHIYGGNFFSALLAPSVSLTGLGLTTMDPLHHRHPQPITAVSASGETQTTIIDQNGNLKVAGDHPSTDTEQNTSETQNTGETAPATGEPNESNQAAASSADTPPPPNRPAEPSSNEDHAATMPAAPPP